MMSHEEYMEEIYKMNANADYLAETFADTIRNCMRASVRNEGVSQINNAVKNFNTLLKILKHVEDVSTYEFIEKTIKLLRVDESHSAVNEAIQQAAKEGTRYLVEKSCADMAARARSSNRKFDFLSAIAQIEREQARYRAGIKI